MDRHRLNLIIGLHWPPSLAAHKDRSKPELEHWGGYRSYEVELGPLNLSVVWTWDNVQEMLAR